MPQSTHWMYPAAFCSSSSEWAALKVTDENTISEVVVGNVILGYPTETKQFPNNYSKGGPSNEIICRFRRQL